MYGASLAFFLRRKVMVTPTPGKKSSCTTRNYAGMLAGQPKSSYTVWELAGGTDEASRPRYNLILLGHTATYHLMRLACLVIFNLTPRAFCLCSVLLPFFY